MNNKTLFKDNVNTCKLKSIISNIWKLSTQD